MATPYDSGLERNPANFQPLTPLSFLARAASVYPEQTAIIHGGRSWTYREFFARAKKLALGARPARHQARRHRRGGARQYAGDAGGALRRRHGRGRAQHHQYKARRRHHRVHARSRRGQGADRRPRVLQRGEGCAGALQGEAAGHRLRRSGIHRRRRTARRHRIRGFSARRRSGIRLADAGRRMGRDFAQLHVGHHRRSQGRRLSSPRRLSAGDRPTSSPAAWASIRSICGRCRCSTATAGAFRGRCRSSRARMSACARCARRRSSTPSPPTR